jgi:hypothetical protein
MKVNLHVDLAQKVLTLTHEYSYAPEEIISIGIALATVVLKERRLGNQVVVIDPDGYQVAEFKEIEPKAIREIAEKYVNSVCAGMAEDSAALVVARLERERDAETAQSDDGHKIDGNTLLIS